MRLLRRNGRAVADAVRSAHGNDTERASRSAVSADRAARYRSLEAALVPFLHGLATGEIDPAASPSQDRAWRNACFLRTLLEHDAGGVSPRTIDAVVAITNAAASRGVAPEVRVDDLDGLPDDVANAADLDDRAHDIAAQATAGWKPALLG